jgi:hypothetical protein
MTEPNESDPTLTAASLEASSPTERIRIKDAFFAAIDEAPGHKATQLAEAAGVTDATLSFMRHQGRDVRISTFQRLLDAMPTDVYLRFYRHLGDRLEQAAQIKYYFAKHRMFAVIMTVGVESSDELSPKRAPSQLDRVSGW